MTVALVGVVLHLQITQTNKERDLMDLTSSKILLGAGGASSTSNNYFIAEYTFKQGSTYFWGYPFSVDVKTVGQNVDNIYVAAKHENNVVIILKLDNSASPLWMREYNASGINPYGYPRNILADSSNGDVYLAGYVPETNHSYDGYLIKYNDSGTLQWQRRCHDSQASLTYNQQFYNKVGLDNSGNIYVFGEGDHSQQITSYDQGLLTKYNSSGVRQWQRHIENSRGFDSVDGFVTSSGDCYLVGKYPDPANGYHQVSITAKYNSSGVLQWQTKGVLQYNSTTRSHYSIYVGHDNSGNIYRGATSSAALHSYHSSISINKENSSGTSLWTSLLGSSTGGTYLRAMCTDSQGNTYAAADTNNIDANTPWCTLIAKWNSSGVLQWQRKLNAGHRAVPGGITVDSNNDVILTGWWMHTSSQKYYPFVAKLPSDGSLTGTYGSWTYQATNLSTGSASTTLSTSSHTDNASNFLDSAFSYSSSNFTDYLLNTVTL